MCYACPEDSVNKTDGNLPAVIEGVMTAMTHSKKEEVKAWEQEFVPCEHTLCLVQQDNLKASSTGSRRADTELETELTSKPQTQTIAQIATWVRTSGYAWSVETRAVGEVNLVEAKETHTVSLMLTQIHMPLPSSLALLQQRAPPMSIATSVTRKEWILSWPHISPIGEFTWLGVKRLKKA